MRSRVETRSGWVEGEAERDAVVFRGIPYARPPTGRGRLRPPRPPESWAGVREATHFGPPAPQNAGTLSRLLGMGTGGGSEDCLHLNVWTPAVDGARRPVLVWIHGGSFTVGAGSWPVFDGAALARRGDAVVVTFNYRLGALGFLPVAWDEGPEGALGNFGLLDQIAALRWVADEIAGFGGDPGNVTLFGESAGAMSIGALLTAPRAKGLFRRAILQSGAAANVHSRAEAEAVAATFAAELGASSVAAERLRALPLADLLAAQGRCAARLRGSVRGLPFQPVADGEVLPRAPIEALRAGDGHPVPVLIGTNLHEWNLFGLADPNARQLDEAGLRERCRRALSGLDGAGRALADLVAERYREAPGPGGRRGPRESWFAIQSDRWFHHPAAALAEVRARHQPDTWCYLFTWESPALGGDLGACHALEIPFVFGGVAAQFGRSFVGDGPAAAGLAARMQDAWLAFARSGDPSHPDLPAWPRYEPERRASMRLGADCALEEAPLEDRRAFWDALAR